MADKNLIAAVRRQVGKQPIYGDVTPDTEGDYKLWVRGEKARNDYQTILNGLPAMMQDHITQSNILQKILGIVAQQQIAINRLSFENEELRRANVALKLQENFNDSLDRISANGRDITDNEVTLKFTAESDLRSEDALDSQSGSSHNESVEMNITGEIQSVLKLLEGLSLGYSDKESRTAQYFEKLATQRMRSIHRSYQGDIHIRVGSITGDPVRKAMAEAISAGKMSPGDDKL